MRHGYRGSRLGRQLIEAPGAIFLPQGPLSREAKEGIYANRGVSELEFRFRTASSHEPNLGIREPSGVPFARNLTGVPRDGLVAAGLGALRKNWPALPWAMRVSEALGQ